jgi:uncharacterized repeat protein (TIGR01451 family)
MRLINDGRLRRLVLTTSLVVIAALAIAGATSARVDVGSSGTTSAFAVATNDGSPKKVFVCKYVGTPGVNERLQTGDNPINVSVNAIPDGASVGAYFADSQGRSFVLAFDTGQPEPPASSCPPPAPDDVCPNIDGVQESVPQGMVKDEQGNCVPPPPVDVCPNLDGVQEHVPDGYHVVDGQCVVIPPPVDVCPNLEGNQATVPDGYVLKNGKCKKVHPPDVCPNIPGKQTTVPEGYTLVDGKCVIVPPPVDVCPNLDGNQPTVPEGYTLVDGKCVIVPPPVDVCPNVQGNQATVPGGLVKNEQGDCVTPPGPPTPPPPPTVKSDEFMDVQVVKDATPQVQLVNGQADIAYSVRVRNSGPNQAHNVVLTDAAPSGVTFLAVTQQPVGGNCTVSAALLSCTLGTLGPGVERSIGLSARVTQTGTFVNSATGTGDGKDTNGANNTDDASTLVTAPVTPPTTTPTAPKPPVKPKPKPAVNICRVLKVTPGMVKANGKRYVVLAKVTRSKTPVKGVQVRFTGTGLSKAVRTDKQGVARLSVKPSRAGIMLVRITSAKACNSARIGVVGVFEPPVTG